MSAASSGTSDDTSKVSPQKNVDLDQVFNPPTRDEWLTQALAGLPNHDSLEALGRKTLDNLSIGVLYDTAPANAYTHLGQRSASPGAWDNRLCLRCMDDTASNKKLLEGLSNGNASVELHVNQDTQLKLLLEGVKLDILPISIRSGDYYQVFARQLHEHISSMPTDASAIRVSFNVDPFGDWLNGVTDLEPHQDRIDSMSRFAIEQTRLLPQAQCVLVDLAVHHNAGASPKQELIAALMMATVYLESLLGQGMSLDDASQSLTFQFACDADVLMGVVKLRSFSHLWRHYLAEMAKSHSTEISEKNLQPHIVVETSKRYLSTVDYWNNHLRNIAACSAAALSSVQTILIHPHDQIGTWQAESDTTLGERMARNLPIILDRECGLTNVIDPMAGSYAIDTLTQQLSDATWDALSDIHSAEIWIQGVLDGQWQQELSASHKYRVTRMSDNQDIMVGVNRYQPTSDNDSIGIVSVSDNSRARLRPVRDSESFEGAAQ